MIYLGSKRPRKKSQGLLGPWGSQVPPWNFGASECAVSGHVLDIAFTPYKAKHTKREVMQGRWRTKVLD